MRRRCLTSFCFFFSCDERDVIRKGNASSDTECKPAAQQHISKISPGSTVISTAGPLRPTNTTPSVSLSVLTTEMIKPTKSPVPSTGPDKQLGMLDGMLTISTFDYFN